MTLSEISRDSIPKGFDVRVDPDDGAVYILHRRTGMYVLNGFLMVWLAGWTAGCCFLSREYYRGLTVKGYEDVPLWFVSLFWLMWLCGAYWLVYVLFTKRFYVLADNQLTMEVNLFRFKRTKVIPFDTIQRFCQAKDGGEGEDSFPSWGLVAETDTKKVGILYRQQYEKSHWFGRVLAEYVGVDFVEVPYK